MKLFEFVNLGGWINWILFGILCFCICQCIERCIYFFSTSARNKKHGFMSRIEFCAEKIKKFPKEKQKKLLEKETSLLYYEMNRGLWFLNFICAVSPSIGLLGTVVGLIEAFQKMSVLGAQVSMQDLSGGIWVAMITTEFGMMISIPGIFFYRTFKRIIEKRMMAVSIYLDDILETGNEKSGSEFVSSEKQNEE